jgi:biotin transport system substrate-specific component
MSTSAPPVGAYPVLADALGESRTRNVILIVAGALLTAVCAQIAIHVPPSPVPITGQTFAVVMAGACLGARRGGSSQLLYVLVGLALPIYADGASGWHTVWGPSGGYLVAFPIAAWAIGQLAERGRDRYVLTAFASYVAGQLIIFGIGVPWLKVSADLSWATAVHDGFTIFIIGGLIKAAAAGVLTPTAWRAVRRYER